MSVRNHTDPQNPSDLANLIRMIPSDPDELIPFIQTTLPNWLIKTSPQFSIDLFKFNEQWAYACIQLNVRPQCVLIVSETYLDVQNTTHTFVREVCRRLTTKGFIVVDSINFGTCEECHEVMVSKLRFKQAKKQYHGVCERCYKIDKNKVN